MQLMFLLLGLGFALRLPGMMHDLWLDEIWSITLIRKLSSPLGIFTEIRYDNNHWLNSLYLYFAMNTKNARTKVQLRISDVVDMVFRGLKDGFCDASATSRREVKFRRAFA